MRNYLKILLLFIFVTSVCPAQEYPERIILNQDGVDAAFYNLNGMQYRYFSLFDADKVAEEIPAAFSVKLEDSSNPKDILFYGSTNLGLKFSLADGVKLPSEKIGENLLVGCKKGGGDGQFIIYTASLMPDDLVLFEQKKSHLLKDKATIPEDYFILGDWIDMAKKQSQIIEEDVYQKYVNNSNWAYGRALELSEKALNVSAGETVEYYKRMKDFYDKMGEAPEGKAAGIVSAVYKEFMDKSENLPELASADKLDEKQIKDYAAAMYLVIGGIYDELLMKPDEAKRLLLVSAGVSAEYPEVKRRMSGLDYVLYNEKWMTKRERDAIIEKEEQALKAKLSSAEQKKKEEAEKIIRQAMSSGVGVEKAMLDADYLLSLEKSSGLKELVGELEKMPLEVAVYSLYQMVSWYGVDSEKFLEGILEGKNVALKKYAAGFLCALGSSSAQKVSARFSVEKSEEVLKDYTDALWRVEGNEGISNMLAIIRSTGISKDVRAHAAEYMKSETGQNFGLDPFAWKKWWGDNSENFKRKAVYQK